MVVAVEVVVVGVAVFVRSMRERGFIERLKLSDRDDGAAQSVISVCVGGVFLARSSCWSLARPSVC